MGTFIVGAALVLCIGLALRSVIKSHKSGGCAGGCAGCPGACHMPDTKKH